MQDLGEGLGESGTALEALREPYIYFPGPKTIIGLSALDPPSRLPMQGLGDGPGALCFFRGLFLVHF